MRLLLKSAQSRTAECLPPSKDPTEEQRQSNANWMLANGKRLHSTKDGTADLWEHGLHQELDPHFSSSLSPNKEKIHLRDSVANPLQKTQKLLESHPLLPWVLPVRTQPNELSSPRAVPVRWSAGTRTLPIPPAATWSQTRGLWPSTQGSSKFIWACLNPFRIWPLAAQGTICCPSEMSMCTVKSPH